MNKTLFLADDHPIFRQGLAQLVSSIKGIELIGTADNGCDALRFISESLPDIAILDLAMPGTDGLTVLKKAKLAHPDLAVIILTSYDDQAYLTETLAAGASAYLLKDGDNDEIINCVQTVAAGGIFVSAIMGHSESLQLPDIPDDDNFLLSKLTDIEFKVLQGVARFQTSKEIADSIGITYRTVQNHRSRIGRKLNLQGRHQLVQFARQHKTKILRMEK